MSDFPVEETKPEETPVIVAEAASEVSEAPAEEVVLKPNIDAMPQAEPEEVADKKAPKKAEKAAPTGRSYKRGDAGVDIRTIQVYLNTKGFACPETGIFCVHTHEAVKRFQKSLGAAEDGVISEDMISLTK